MKNAQSKRQRCVRCDKVFSTPKSRVFSNIICPSCNRKDK